MRNEITISDTQIEEAFDEAGHGVDIDDVEFTRESLEDYRTARKSYNEPGHFSDEELAGYAAIIIEKAQPFSGQRRKDVVVIDFGTVRAVIAI